MATPRKGMTTDARRKKTSSSSQSSSSKKPGQNTNRDRRKVGLTGLEDVWYDFVEGVESELKAASELPAELRKSPYYAHANVVKRAVYDFMIYARRSLKPGPLGKTIDAIRLAHADDKILRTLRTDFRREPYYWILTGLHYNCPDAKLSKSDVTRFAQHLKYANRHKVPSEFLIGFLLQTGSLAEVYRRAKNPDHREAWFPVKENPDSHI